MTRTVVVRTAGTNCDGELVRAFQMAGSAVDLVHLDRLIADPPSLERYGIIAFPGGFSYGDDVASGRIFAMRIREHLAPALLAAARRGCPMIGVCNGFQVLVQVGLLPGPEPGEPWPEDRPPRQVLSLAVNDSGRFVDRWVPVRFDADSPCIWTAGLAESISPRACVLPVAHGEGRLVARDEDQIRRLADTGRVPIRYLENPNGSIGDAAAVCDASGRVLGLMPHPERYIQWVHHPFWTRLVAEDRGGEPLGLRIFQNAVRAAQHVEA